VRLRHDGDVGRSLRFEPGVAGIDEAGRGPLAGPVVAAAVILPEGFDCRGIDDSKRLDPESRESAARRIEERARWSLSVVDAETIDRLNILEATLLAMARACNGLAPPPCHALVDGNRVPRALPCEAEAIVRGDARHACIAAASILAKSTRDAIMRRYAAEFPGYGFERHFGYATPEHLQAIRSLGPCPIHRMSFHPLRPESQPCLTLDV
jgi:ribonuclease HII